MSTRSHIGIKNASGSIEFIYCHHDGYPSHHLPILTTHYATEQKVRELISLGDLSSLDVSIGQKHDFDACPDGQCNYYGRDRGERNIGPQAAYDESIFDCRANGDCAYLFKDGQWWWRERHGKWSLGVS